MVGTQGGVERVKDGGFSWWGNQDPARCLVQPKEKKFKFQMGAFLKCESKEKVISKKPSEPKNILLATCKGEMRQTKGEKRATPWGPEDLNSHQGVKPGPLPGWSFNHCTQGRPLIAFYLDDDG